MRERDNAGKTRTGIDHNQAERIDPVNEFAEEPGAKLSRYAGAAVPQNERDCGGQDVHGALDKGLVADGPPFDTNSAKPMY